MRQTLQQQQRGALRHLYYSLKILRMLPQSEGYVRMTIRAFNDCERLGIFK